MTEKPEHKQGCDALGGYGQGVGPCSCGAAGLLVGEVLPVFGYVIVEHHVTPDTPMGPAEYNTDTHFDFEPFCGGDNIAVVRLSDAQATIAVQAAEIERLKRERDDLNAARNAAIELANSRFDQLKAKQVADIDEVLAAGGLMANTMFNLAQQTHKFGDYHCKLFKSMRVRWDAAREALRSAMAASTPQGQEKTR